MSEANQCTVTIKNETPFVLELDEAHVDWGKFSHGAEPKIPAGKQMLAFEASGRSWSPTGTEGHVHYRIGTTGQKLKLHFENSWAFWNHDGFDADTGPPRVSTFMAMQLNSGIETPLVAVFALPDGFRFQGGWYEIDHGLHQTFVSAEFDVDVEGRSEKKRLWFDCYGTHTGPNRRFPAHHASGPGDLERVLLVACGDVNDHRIRYDRLDGSFYELGWSDGLGDCAGVLYGVTGVCHQMANRILYAADADLQMRPPTAWLSYPAYGPFGSTSALVAWSNWKFPAPFIENVARRAGVELKATTEEEVCRRVKDPYLRAVLDHRMANRDEPANTEREFEIMIDHRLPGLDRHRRNRMLAGQRQFLDRKEELSGQLVGREIPVREFDVVVNAAYMETLAGFDRMLGDDNFTALFGMTEQQARGYRLVDSDTLNAVYRDRGVRR